MPTILQFRRYNQNDISNLAGDIGEIFIELDDNSVPVSLRIQDGSTQGGGLRLSNDVADLTGSIENSELLSQAFNLKLNIDDYDNHVSGTSDFHDAESILYTDSTYSEGASDNVNLALNRLFTATNGAIITSKIQEQLSTSNKIVYTFTRSPIPDSLLIYIDGIYHHPGLYTLDSINKTVQFSFEVGPLSTVFAVYEFEVI